MTDVNIRKLPFDEAVHEWARTLRNADQAELSAQIIGAARAVKASDVAHVSTAISELTAEQVAKNVYPNIPEQAVVLDEVKRTLFKLSSPPLVEADGAIAGGPGGVF
jgi:hypothetical protein